MHLNTSLHDSAPYTNAQHKPAVKFNWNKDGFKTLGLPDFICGWKHTYTELLAQKQYQSLINFEQMDPVIKSAWINKSL